MSASDAVRTFMRERGLADEVVDEGVEGLLSRWEQAAREAELETYPFGIEDWLNDLDGRQVMHDLAAAVPDAFGDHTRARLDEADARVEAATEKSAACLWGPKLAKRMGWKPAREWWYWRVPRAVNDDFAGA